MADEQVIRQLKERVAFLDTLVMTLVAKNEPSNSLVATHANVKPRTSVPSAPATTDEGPKGEVPYLMKLPPEIRMDIIERVTHPTFAAEPYGLNAPPRLPVTIYTSLTSLTRFPAVLQVDRIMRTESMTVYLSLARSKIVDLEIANKNRYDEYEDLRKDLEGKNTLYGDDGWGFNAKLQALGGDVVRNYAAMRELDSSCKALQGIFECKQPLPKRWLGSAW
jgi:hypothetical protein